MEFTDNTDNDDEQEISDTHTFTELITASTVPNGSKLFHSAALPSKQQSLTIAKADFWGQKSQNGFFNDLLN